MKSFKLTSRWRYSGSLSCFHPVLLPYSIDVSGLKEGLIYSHLSPSSAVSPGPIWQADLSLDFHNIQYTPYFKKIHQ